MLLALAPTVVPSNLSYQMYCKPTRALNHGHPGAKLLDERDVGDLADPAVAVRTEAAGKSRIQDRIGAAPGVEILAGQHDPVAIAVGQRGIGVRLFEIVGRVGGKPLGKLASSFWYSRT